MKNHVSLIYLFVGLFSFNHALCEVRSRCINDPLNNVEQIRKRNLWAAKCGFIPNNLATFFISQNMYPSFAIIPDTAAFVAPVDDSLPCVGADKIKRDGICEGLQGCYTEDMKLDFASFGIEEIATAQEQDFPVIKTLSSNSTLENLHYQEGKIEFFLKGKTDENIYVLTLENGKVLKLTKTHPLVDGEGLMKKASEFNANDLLLDESGQKIKIVRTEIIPFKGNVYNVLPQSEDKYENIFSVEGILTGSVRYQNEWANVESRLKARLY